MFLGNPSLPIAFNSKKAGQAVEAAFSERNWKGVSIASPKLILTPYYFFEYSTYTEEERHGENIVSGVERAKLVLDPESSEVIDGLAQIMPADDEMLHSLEGIDDFEIRKTGLDEEKAEKICQLKTAEKLGKALNKIVIEGIRLFYVPLWEIKATFGKQEIALHVSATTGTILESEKLPFKEKTASEIAKETIQELKEPKAWLKYSRELLEMAFKPSSGPSFGFMHQIKSHFLWIIVLVLLVILMAAIFLM